MASQLKIAGLVPASGVGTFDRPQAGAVHDRRQTGPAKIIGAVFGLNPQNPDRNDGPEHGQARNRPARHVSRAIRLRPVHHRIVPVGHNSLQKIASGG